MVSPRPFSTPRTAVLLAAVAAVKAAAVVWGVTPRFILTALAAELDDVLDVEPSA